MRISKIILKPFGRLDNYAHWVTCLMLVSVLHNVMSIDAPLWMFIAWVPEIIVFITANGKELIFDKDWEWTDYIYNTIGTLSYRPIAYILSIIFSCF